MNNSLKLFGSRLKETIDEKGVSVEEISKATKIRKILIEAVINGNRDNLPDEVFVIGYLKAILDFLKVDPQSYIDEYKSLNVSKNLSEDNKKVVYSPLSQIKTKSYLFLWISIVFFILIFSALFLFRTSDKKNIWFSFKKNSKLENMKTVKEGNILNSLSDKQSELKDEEKNKTLINKLPQDGLIIKAFSQCWIELFDGSSKVLLKREVTEGEKLVFKGKSFKITLGDSSAVKLFFEGKEISFPQEKGKVLRDFRILGESK